ncbi:MAG: hypothetical protein SVV03_05685 [Candidatus Nanohaloarchaea archaeon]|nr:hypothetical protein [Candidatus Nanohaloarchaea archaeon]
MEMDRRLYMYRERLSDLAERIGRDVDAVIVEGKCDERALKKLGMETDIFKVGRCSIEPFCERISDIAESVVILTDFDSEGKEINKELRQRLVEETDVLGSYRKDFGKLMTSKDRYCIEDLNPLFNSPFDKFIDADLDRLFTPLA